MNKLEELIKEFCPNGVEYKPLWSLTAWDKRFNGIDRSMQKKVVSYKYYLSSEFNEVERKDGDILYIPTGITNEKRYTTEELAGEYLAEGEIVCIPWGGTPNVKYHKGKFVTGDNRIATSLDTNILDNKYLYYWMQSKIDLIASFYRGAGIQHPSMKSVLELQIPLPALPVQREIVRILDSFTLYSAELTAELTARRKQYEFYRDKLLNFNQQEVEIKKLSDIFDTRNGYTPSTSNKEYWATNDIPWFRVEDIRANGRILNDSIQHVSFSAIKGKVFPANSIIISTSATIGEHALITCESIANQRFTYLMLKDKYKNKYNIKYLFYYCFLLADFCRENLQQGNFASVDMSKFNKFEFPIPPMDVQERIVRVLDNFDSLCNDLSAGLPAEIEKRQKQYEYYRDKLLRF